MSLTGELSPGRQKAGQPRYENMVRRRKRYKIYGSVKIF